MSARSRLGLLAATAFMSGCTTLGGNVRGTFSCRAPAGTCAPTTAIDAQAIGHDAVNRLADSATGRAHSLVTGALAGPALRVAERTITIIFPPYVDEAGVLHDQAMAHAVVEPPHWAERSADPVSFSRSPAPSSLREVVAGASAPATEGLEPLPTQAPHPIAHVNGAPSPEAIAAARAGHRIERQGVTLSDAQKGGNASGAATSPVEPGAGTTREPVRKASAPTLAEPGREPDLEDVFRRGQGPGGGE